MFKLTTEYKLERSSATTSAAYPNFLARQICVDSAQSTYWAGRLWYANKDGIRKGVTWVAWIIGDLVTGKWQVAGPGFNTNGKNLLAPEKYPFSADALEHMAIKAAIVAWIKGQIALGVSLQEPLPITPQGLVTKPVGSVESDPEGKTTFTSTEFAAVQPGDDEELVIAIRDITCGIFHIKTEAFETGDEDVHQSARRVAIDIMREREKQGCDLVAKHLKRTATAIRVIAYRAKVNQTKNAYEREKRDEIVTSLDAWIRKRKLAAHRASRAALRGEGEHQPQAQ